MKTEKGTQELAFGNKTLQSFCAKELGGGGILVCLLAFLILFFEEEAKKQAR